jgi:hypothetical protein
LGYALSFLTYSQLVDEVGEKEKAEKNIIGVDYESLLDLGAIRMDIPELGVPGLLRPPRVELICPDIVLVDGHLDGIMQVNTSENFGVLDVYVILEDDQGNPIESDYAMENDYVENHWGYIPFAPLPPGRQSSSMPLPWTHWAEWEYTVKLLPWARQVSEMNKHLLNSLDPARLTPWNG